MAQPKKNSYDRGTSGPPHSSGRKHHPPAHCNTYANHLELNCLPYGVRRLQASWFYIPSLCMAICVKLGAALVGCTGVGTIVKPPSGKRTMYTLGHLRTARVEWKAEENPSVVVCRKRRSNLTNQFCQYTCTSHPEEKPPPPVTLLTDGLHTESNNPFKSI